MKTKSNSKCLITESFLKLLVKIEDPFSISFYIADLVAQVIENVFIQFNHVEFDNLYIYELTKQLENMKIDLKNISNIEKFLNSSQYYKKTYETAKNQLIELVKEYFIINNGAHFYHYDAQSERIFIKKYDSLISHLEEEIKKENNVRKNIIEHADGEKQFLIFELKKMYKSAESGYQMTSLHLFGIKYYEQIIKYSTKDIVIKALGKSSFVTEVSKGMKLAKFVELKGETRSKVSEFKRFANNSNYRDYTFADDRIPFEYTKPIQIKYRNKINKCNSWGKVLSVICEIVIEIDQRRFANIVENNLIHKSIRSFGSNLQFDPLINQNLDYFIEGYQIQDSIYYCESKLGSKYALKYSKDLLLAMDLNPREFIISIV